MVNAANSSLKVTCTPCWSAWSKVGDCECCAAT